MFQTLFAAMLFAVGIALGADETKNIVVRVNGTAITSGDLEFAASTHQIKPEERPAREAKLIEELIDRQLIREFLSKRKFTAPTDELAYQIQLAEDAIRKHGDDPATLLPRLGYTPDRLKSELGLPLAWQAYVRQTVTLPQTRDYYEQHRAELDGTQIKARQIFLKLPSKAAESEIDPAKKRLTDLRNQITSGKISFADAARKFSESPTRDQGGDLGTIGFRGKLPAPVAKAAFSLNINEISEPVVSAFGVHLIQVTERIPGELSLEDVRPQIFERLSDQLWTETVHRERQSAKIELTK